MNEGDAVLASHKRSARIARAILGIAALYMGVIAAGLRILYQLRLLGPDNVEPLFLAMIAHAILVIPLGVSFFWACRRDLCPPRLPPLLCCTAAVLFIASLDVLVGIVYPAPAGRRGVCIPHAARGWTNRRSFTGSLDRVSMRFDENGMRIDENGGGEPATGKRRALFVGDSLTLGYDVRANEMYGCQAVAILNERGASEKWIALNGGTCGYDTRQEYHWFEHEGLRLEPNLVVLQLCLNDVSWQFASGRSEESILQNDMDGVTPMTSWSGFGRAAIAWGKRLRFGDDLGAAAARIERMSVQEVIKNPGLDKVRRAWENVFAQIELFEKTCRQRGIPLVLVLFPVSDQIEEPHLGDAPQQALGQFARERSIPFLDVLPIFRRRGGEGPAAKGKLFLEFTHPTVLGHRFAAEGLVDLVDRAGISSPGSAITLPSSARSAKAP